MATIPRETARSDEENKELTRLALKGLQLLSSWTQQVMELVILFTKPYLSPW